MLGVEEQRPGGALADVVLQRPQDDGGEGLGGGRAALAHDAQHLVAALMREGLDVAGEDFGDAQAVVDEQAHERRRLWAVRFGGRQELVKLLGGEADSGRVVGDLRSAHVGDGRVLEQPSVLDAVVVELRQARQAPSDRRRRRRPTSPVLRLLLEMADPGVDVVAAGGQRVYAGRRAPGVPGLEIAEVRTRRVRRIADEKGGDQAPLRIDVAGARQAVKGLDGKVGHRRRQGDVVGEPLEVAVHDRLLS